MNRREFLQMGSLLAAGGLSIGRLSASDLVAQEGPALAGTPMIQNPAADGLTIFVPVQRPCTVWVEYGSTPDLGQTAVPLEHGLHPLDARIHRIRLSNLRPGQRVFYRVHVAPIDFRGPYQIKRLPAESTDILRTRTLSSVADEAHVAFINDTHEKPDLLAALGDDLIKTSPDFAFWNGDVFDDIRSDEQIYKQFVNGGQSRFASACPVAFVCGNHDVRGVHARELSRFVDTPGGLRYYLMRQGPVAFVVLDTGEDKPDNHPVYAGLGGFALYRAQQKAWLARAINHVDFRSAPYKVLVCHIPLVGEHSSEDSLRQWQDELTAAGIQLAVHGHVHAPSLTPKGEVPWVQMVGGGPSLLRATIIRLRANRREMTAAATTLAGETLFQTTINPSG